jgi:hypothetical protein
MSWNTANSTLPTAEEDRQERHLEQAKDRCLKEFKGGYNNAALGAVRYFW